MPVWPGRDPGVVFDPGTDPASTEGTADIEIITGLQIELPQPSHLHRLWLTCGEHQQIGPRPRGDVIQSVLFLHDKAHYRKTSGLARNTISS